MTWVKKCSGIHREKGLARKWPEPVARRVTESVTELSPSFLLAQAILEPNLFPYEYPYIS